MRRAAGIGAIFCLAGIAAGEKAGALPKTALPTPVPDLIGRIEACNRWSGEEP